MLVGLHFNTKLLVATLCTCPIETRPWYFLARSDADLKDNVEIKTGIDLLLKSQEIPESGYSSTKVSAASSPTSSIDTPVDSLLMSTTNENLEKTLNLKNLEASVKMEEFFPKLELRPRIVLTSSDGTTTNLISTLTNSEENAKSPFEKEVNVKKLADEENKEFGNVEKKLLNIFGLEPEPEREKEAPQTRYLTKEGEFSIQSCLNQFTALELMTGNNKVGCEACTAKANKVGSKLIVNIEMMNC